MEIPMSVSYIAHICLAHACCTDAFVLGWVRLGILPTLTQFPSSSGLQRGRDHARLGPLVLQLAKLRSSTSTRTGTHWKRRKACMVHAMSSLTAH